MRMGCFWRDDFACLPRGRKTRPFLLSELGHETRPQKKLRKPEKMCLNLMLKMGRELHAFLNGKIGVDSSFISAADLGRICSEKSALLTDIHYLQRIDKLSYYIEGKNPAKPHRENQRNRRECPPIYREAEKTENVSDKIHFSLVFKGRPVGLPHHILKNSFLICTAYGTLLQWARNPNPRQA